MTAHKLMGKLMLLLTTATVAALAIVAGCSNDDTVFVPVSSTSSTSSATFMGSEKCSTCHKAIYASWKDSNHTKKFLPAVDENILPDSDGDGTNDFKEATNGILLGSSTTDQYNDDDWTAYGASAPTLKYDSTKAVYQAIIGGKTYDIANVIGASGKWKQRYTTEVTVGDRKVNYILPLQYNVKTNRWTTFHAGDWYDSSKAPLSLPTLNFTWEAKCMACHTTGVEDVTLDEANKASDGRLDTFTAKFNEVNIGCEACHGPASNHISLGGGRGTIVNPADMAQDRGNEVCGVCHSRGDSVSVTTSADGVVSSYKHGYPQATDGSFFRPGDTLSDFYTFKDRSGSEFWSDATTTSSSHHQQWLDMLMSPHVTAGLTCWSCHDPHGSTFEGDLKMEANALCLSCHDGEGDISSTNVSAHTRHNAENSDANTCTSCHLPYTAKSAEKYDIRSHTFRIIYPVESATVSGFPNSCQNGACHADDSNDEMQDRLDVKWGNLRPVASASASEDTTTTGVWYLDGSKSFDPNKDTLTYQWRFVTGPDAAGSTGHVLDDTAFLSETSVRPAIVTPLPGKYTFSLIATDSKGLQSHPTEVSFTATTAATKTTVTSTSFVGSKDTTGCGKTGCHEAIVSDWSQTAHTRKIRAATMDTVICDGNSNGVNDFVDGSGTTSANAVVLGSDDGTAAGTAAATANAAANYNSVHWQAYHAAGEGPRLWYDTTNKKFMMTIGASGKDIEVTHVLGGNSKWKQRYITTVQVTDGTTTHNVRFMLPIQYNSVDHNYDSYNPDRWYDTATKAPLTTIPAAGKSWNGNCITCHTTGVTDVKKSATATYPATVPSWVDQANEPATSLWLATWKEDNVGCEACHGPGDQHVQNPFGGGTINPRKLSVERANEACGNCHDRGTSRHANATGMPRAADGSFPKPGDTLETFFTLTDSSSSVWGNANASEKGHHQQWMGYRPSKHSEAGVLCFDCHAPHKPLESAQLKADPTTLCKSCHPEIVDNASTPSKNHSRHATGTAANGDCVSCHMPTTASSAHRSNTDPADADLKENAYEIHTHNTRVVLPMDANGQGGMPNSCASWYCHSGASGETADLTWNFRSTKDDNSEGYTGVTASNGVYDWIEIATKKLNDSWGDLKPYASARFEVNAGKPIKLGRIISGVPVTVQLDGLASYDPNGGKIAGYTWMAASTNPSGATLSSTSAARPTVAITTAGTYTFTLVVRDDRQTSETDSVTFVVE